MKMIKNIKEVQNYKMTGKQAVAYAVVALDRFKKSGNLEIKNKLFAEYMITLMQIHSIDEIEKIAKEILKNEVI